MRVISYLIFFISETITMSTEILFLEISHELYNTSSFVRSMSTIGIGMTYVNIYVIRD
jgi:hypothetical protein